MTEAQAPAAASIELDEIAALPELERVQARLDAKRTLAVGGLWGSSQALVLAALSRRVPTALVAIASTDAEARAFADDLAALGLAPSFLPESEARDDVDGLRERLAVAAALSGPPEARPRIVVGSLGAWLRPMPRRETLAGEVLSLAVGERLVLDHLLKRLTSRGYARQPLVERQGEVSLRGDILDLFPFASEEPLRIELFDDEIESLRNFDPGSQRSTAARDSIELMLASAEVLDGAEGVDPVTLLPPTAVFVEIEPLRIEDIAQSMRVRTPDLGRAHDALARAMQAGRRLKLQSLPTRDLDLDTRSVQALQVGMRDAPTALRDLAESGQRVVVLCQNEGERHRFVEHLAAEGGITGLTAAIGPLAKGFRFPAARLVVINHRELVGIVGRRHVRHEKAAHRTRAIQSFFELKTGDHVVHAVHGLARFDGLVRMQRGEGEEDHLLLMFADEVSLYVPATRIDVVQRYIGSGAHVPALDRIGGQSFRKRKEKVQRALVDLAADLLEVHARRALNKRDAWPADDELVKDLLDSFPYQDTKDQVTTDSDVRSDLSGDTPMDRLICGDVGFGKTELAVRAAFRVVNGGGQVVVLVPTTVLAQQHYLTFRARLADFPVRVELLSRYVAPQKVKEVVGAAQRGEVDILVGTHRVLSKDVKLPRLGLAIIDEEQRFGVAHKEHFKRFRAGIDVLTLSATPIPRTLHMSIAGVRDISALTVAPDGRQEIETRLGYVEDDDLIREALLREKHRGGQVFYLHNRVESIEAVAQRLVNLVPECSFAVGHGQMTARELEQVMKVFTRGEVDVLVATTIIESGLDIPSAGTILVHDADHFGLSELHQLRGRVGRGEHKAHCWLLIEKFKPLRQVARDRLKALEEMTQLGAGFAISMKDLEIRGAGNILGPEQSGHIGAVGYDLYCRLLKATIDRLQSGEAREELAREELLEEGVELELGLESYLPKDWFADADRRLELLRELAAVRTDEDRKQAEAMLKDRFGRVPAPAKNLLRSFQLAAFLSERGVRRLAWQGDAYLVEFKDRLALEQWLAPSGERLRPIRSGVARLVPAKAKSAEEALRWIEKLVARASA